MLGHNPKRPGIAALMAEGPAVAPEADDRLLRGVCAGSPDQRRGTDGSGGSPWRWSCSSPEDPVQSPGAGGGSCAGSEPGAAERGVGDLRRRRWPMLPPGGGRRPPLCWRRSSWHQGVVGIVASRIAEEFGCPTFLICLDGEQREGQLPELSGALTCLLP